MGEAAKANIQAAREKIIKEIPFDLEKIAYGVEWEDNISRESDGVTYVRDIGKLVGKIPFRESGKDHYTGLSSGDPYIIQLKDPEGIFNVKEHVYLDSIETYKNDIEHRGLFKDEMDIVYDSIKSDLIKRFTPDELINVVLPIFTGRGLEIF